MADVLAYEITGIGSDLFGIVDLNTGVFTSLGYTGSRFSSQSAHEPLAPLSNQRARHPLRKILRYD